MIIKKIISVIVLLFVFLQLQSQGFKPSFFAAANASATKSRTDNIKVKEPGFGYSFFFKEEYYLPHILSLGAEIGYSNIKTIFQTESPDVSIPEVKNYFNNAVTTGQLEIPLILKLRGRKENRNLYIFAGAGLNYVISSYRKVDHVSYDMFNPADKEITQLLKGSFSFAKKNGIGNFSVFGLGRNFMILGAKLFVEVRYRNNLTSWEYPTSFNALQDEISMRVHSLSFNMGFIF